MKKIVILLAAIILVGAAGWYWFNFYNQSSTFFSGCEQRVDDSYQNTVPAKIEMFGSNYVLTLHCRNGDSSIGIAEPTGLDKYLNTSVTVKYQYIDYFNPVKCVRAPCPPVNETRVKIISITKAGTPSSQTYRNSQYGFLIALPDTWDGYKVLNSQWEGRDVATSNVTTTGPIITLRHPLWTVSAPREDMPIMIFTLAQWTLVQQEKIAVSAAPIPPSVLGQNSKYIIALPARYNYDFKTGFEEVDQLVHKLTAFEPAQ